MNDLCLRSLQGRLAPHEEQLLLQWRQVSAIHEEQYQQYVRLWNLLREEDVRTAAPPTSQLLAHARTRELATAGSSPFRSRSTWTWLAAAATILIALFAGGLASRYGEPEDYPSLAALTLITGPDETAMGELADGTIVHLAPNSRMEVLPDPHRRLVEVSGRAFFGVAKGVDWPFVVRAGEREAVVTGTRFEFVSDQDSVRVLVVEGSVSLSAGGTRVNVGAGEMSSGSRTAPLVVEPVENIEGILSWMGQTLIFHDTPLAKAAEEIARQYQLSVEVRGDELAKRTVSGGFKNRSFEDVVSVICRVTYAECLITSSGAVLSSI